MTVLKHFLLVLVLCLSTTCFGQLTNDYGQYKVVNGDTVLTNFPLKSARKAAYKSELLKEYMVQVDSLNQQIEYFEEKIKLEQDKNSITVEHYESQIANWKEQKGLLLDTIASLNKEIRRLKRGKRWASVGGVLSTAAAIFISIKK